MKRLYARPHWIDPAESLWLERGCAESQPRSVFEGFCLAPEGLAVVTNILFSAFFVL